MKIEDLNQELLEDIAKMLKALSDTTRLSIMQCLHYEELCVGDIVERLKAKQANISKHLQVLLQVNLLKARRNGTSVYYSPYNQAVKKMCESICRTYGKTIEQKYYPSLKK